jgi:hypothetical protein
MSVYVGIDVHRKRSQVAVVAEGGTVELSKNVVSGSGPMLRLIGDLPAGTPVASGAAFGWGWLVALLEDYGIRPAPGAPAAVQGDRLGPAEERQGRCRDLGAAAARGPAARGGVAPPQVRRLRALLRHRASLVRVGTGQRNRIHAVAADHGDDRSASCRAGPGRGWLAGPGPARGLAGDHHRLPGSDRRPGPGDRPDRWRAACPGPGPARGSRC